MTVSDRDLFLAILSMDSYNRGYDPGIRGLAGPGTSIGNARLVDESDVAEGSQGVAAGFYAAAYETEYGTVISYRGTDFDGGPAVEDVYNGWAFATGDFTADQLELSTEFLETVALEVVSFDVTLTGHSLGGGLAVLLH